MQKYDRKAYFNSMLGRIYGCKKSKLTHCIKRAVR
jgi:hypothetical protein